MTLDERLNNISQIACGTFAITQLELQVLSVIANVFKQQDMPAPPGLVQLAVDISQRSRMLLPLVEAELSTAASAPPDLFGLTSTGTAEGKESTNG